VCYHTGSAFYLTPKTVCHPNPEKLTYGTLIVVKFILFEFKLLTKFIWHILVSSLLIILTQNWSISCASSQLTTMRCVREKGTCWGCGRGGGGNDWDFSYEIWNGMKKWYEKILLFAALLIYLFNNLFS